MTSPSSDHTLPDSTDQGDLAFILLGPISSSCPGSPDLLVLRAGWAHSPPSSHQPVPALPETCSS